ncbi:hypothetical protein C2S52_013757 [Perilla frutescens var. hirtella]|nr:hypothetical protein C2S52_013757 [Perilla frutescens var. hirtella]
MATYLGWITSGIILGRKTTIVYSNPVLGKLCLSFYINNCAAVFGSAKFSLITGLKFKEWSEPPTYSNFHEIVFDGSEDLVFHDIHKAFMKECKATAGESDNSLKLALLYIVYGILLIRDRKWKRLDLRYMHLVDDLSRFNEFPWGLVAFEFLVRSTHRARDVVENMLAENKNLSFEANGFSIALLIWVMMRWSALKYLQFDKIHTLFMKSHTDEAPVLMEPSKEEKLLLDQLGVHTVIECPTALVNDGGHKPKKRSDTQFDMNGIDCTVIEGLISDGLSSPMSKESLLTRVASLESSLLQLRGLSNGVVHGVGTRLALQHPMSVDSSKNHAMDGPCECDLCGPPVVEENHVNNADPLIGMTQQHHDSYELALDHRRLRVYELWYKNLKLQQSYRSPVKVMLPGYVVANGECFDDLWARDFYLHDHHMDALMNMLFIYPNYRSSHWALLLLFCWTHLLNNRDFSRVARKMIPYVHGEYPHQTGRPWHMVSYLYRVGYFARHWIAYEVSLGERRITVYDSICHISMCDEFARCFQIMGRNIETLIALDDVCYSAYVPDLVNPF